MSYRVAATQVHTPFVELAATGSNDWWRYLLSLVGVFIGYFLAYLVILIVVLVVLMVFTLDLRHDVEIETQILVENLVWSSSDFDTWRAAGDTEVLGFFISRLLPFSLALVIILIVTSRIHKRHWRTLISARPRFHWPGFRLSLGVTAGLTGAMVIADLLVVPAAIDVVFDPRRYLLFLPFVLVLVPLQVLAEEALFRGYLLQMVARLTPRYALRLLVPAALFVVVHLWNREVEYGGVWAILIFTIEGIYLTFLAIRGEGLEYSLGFHLAINFFGLLVIGNEASAFLSPTILIVRSTDLTLTVPAVAVLCALHYWIVFRLCRP